MKPNFDSWSTSISSILKRTESNLSKGRHSTSDYFHTKDQLTPEPKILISDSQHSIHSTSHYPQDDPPSLSLQEFLQYKSQISEKIYKQDQELEKLKRKLSIRERSESEIPALREDFNFALNAVEKKCISESKKQVANAFKTIEKSWKQTFEGFKCELSEKIVTFENLIKEFRENFKDLKKTLQAENQEKIENDLKDFVKIGKINEVKTGFVKEIEQAKQLFMSEIENLKQDIEGFNISTQKSLRKEVDRMEKKLKQMNIEVSESNEEKIRVVNELEKEVINLKGEFDGICNDIGSLKKDKRQIRKIQENFGKVKIILDELPDFTEFCKKNELLEQTTQIVQFFRTELDKKQDISTQIPEFVQNHQLDQLSEQISNKLESFKSTLVSKLDFEKLKKHILRKLKEPERVSTGSMINSDKISDSIITKLVQLEQRVCVLEDFYETDSIAGTPEEKLGKEKSFFTSTELNSREIPSLLLSKMTPLKDECGSGFFEGMFVGGSTSPRYLGNFIQRHSMESKIMQ